MLSKLIKNTPAIFVVISSLFLLSACQTTDGNLYGYDFQSARITYQITGSNTGSSIVFIKGEKKVIKNNIVQTRPDGTKSPVDSYIIQNGDKQYTLDPQTKTGSLITNPMYAQLKALSPEQRKAKLIEETVRSNDDLPPVTEKQETVAGQKCDFFPGTVTKTCLWQAIPLKTITSLPDYGIQVETTATKIELNQPILDSEFDVPSDYQITVIK